ncbi:MAG TPA: pentapeptide repeat-containing protein, partial [Pyrinomonadaceae bacterium]
MVPTSSTKESECFVHERIDEEDKPKIRSNVCFDSANYEYEGDYYCLLHYPNNKKINDFTKAFYKRLGLEKYDFRGVWFPTKLKFPAKIYKSKVNFRYATFASKAKFKDTIFEAEADFLKATFLADANFDRTRFCKKVDFYKTIFRAGAYFEDAVFVGEAHFCTTTFSAEASFEKSTFLSKANFDSAKFLESSEIFFKDTKFREKVDFHYAVFAGYVLFEGDKDNQVFLKNSFMDLRDARLNNPERINFHRVGLRPNWFINTDCRKFIFTDIEEFTKINIKSELESLNTRGIKNSKQLFKIACRQLAENAENNNRFEEASNFRRMAFECENLEKKAEIAENKKNLQIIGNEFDISKSFDEIVIKSE